MQSKLLKLVAFLLPFELIVSYVSHALIKPTFGEFYRLFFNGFWGSFFLIVFFFSTKIKNSYLSFFYVILLFIIAGFWEYIVTLILGGLTHEAFAQFVCGFFFPCILLFTLTNLEENQRNTFFKFWYIGTITLIILTIVYSIYNYSSFPEWFRERDWKFKIISFRYAYDLSSGSNPALMILGNFNKASNTLLLMLLLSLKFLNKEKNKKLLIVFWILSTFALILMFSRLVLLWLPFVFYFSGITEKFKSFFKSRYLKYCLIFLTVFFIYQSKEFLKPTFEYLIYSKFDENSEGQGILGTGLNRFEQWKESEKFYSDIGIWFHGMGVGQYGLNRGSSDLGTHNTFLDHFFASGFFVPLVIIILWLIGFLKAFKLMDKSLMIGYIIIFTLFFREYSFSYLYVTSQGGFLFILLIAVPYLNFKNKKILT